MKLHAPFYLNANGKPALLFGDVSLVLLDPYAVSTGGATEAYFEIGPIEGRVWSESIGGGPAKFKGPVEAFTTFLGFLAAAGESYRYEQRIGQPSDNSSLFPMRVVEWTADNSSELISAWSDICDAEGSPNETLIEIS